MSMNSLALASDLSDQELLARIASLAGREREATVELVAHLAVLDTRPALYAAQATGHSSVTARRFYGCPKTPPAIVLRQPELADGFP